MMGWDEEGGVRVRAADAPGFKHVELPEYCKEAYQKAFEETFGFKHYEDLALQLRATLRRVDQKIAGKGENSK